MLNPTPSARARSNKGCTAGFGMAGSVNAVQRLGLQQPAREEGGEGEFGEHHQPRALPGRLLQQGDDAVQRAGAAVGALRRPHLRGGDGDDARQSGLPARTKRPVPGAASTLAPSQITWPRSSVAATRARIGRPW